MMNPEAKNQLNQWDWFVKK